RLAAALADRAWVASTVRQRTAAVAAFLAPLADAALPVLRPVGAHCVLLDVAALPAFADLGDPVATCLAWIYQHTGIRAGQHLATAGEAATPGASGTAIRFAIPLGLPVAAATQAGRRIAELFAAPPPIVELRRVDGAHAPGRDRYYPVVQIPDEVRERLDEGYRPPDENDRLLRAAVPAVTRTLIPARGGAIEAFAAGTGPTVLLMHPFNMGAGVFAQQVAAWSDRYRVIVVHHPGVGATTAAEDLSVAGICDQFAQALDALGAAGPVHLVGASFGSLLAQSYALSRPQSVASLTLLCGSYKYANRSGGLARLEQVVQEDFEYVLTHTDTERLRRDRESLTGVMLASESMDPLIGLRYLDLFDEAPDLLDRLSEIAVPTLIVRGALDSIIPEKTAHVLHGLIPDARLAVLPDGGHFPSVTCADEVSALIGAFLDEQSGLRGPSAPEAAS
ncbi:MAG: alpha/beta fold hydrolase, partial [Catenulispora sp.]|nr:alpha/beta fold hydrolase [Catenulispora sp.]